jgi:carboxyl-terminal processing protease
MCCVPNALAIAPFLLLAILSARLPAQAEVPDQSGPANSEQLETFDTTWRIIDQSHFEPNIKDVDLESVRDEFRPKAAAAANVHELREVIEGMLERLGHSHMGLIPLETARSLSTDQEDLGNGEGLPDAKAGDGEPGFELRLLNGQAIVTRVDPGGPAAKAGVKPGWIIKAIDGEEVSDALPAWIPTIETHRAQYLAWNVIRTRLLGRPGSSLAVKFETGEEQVTLRIERRHETGQPSRLGYLPPFYSRFEKRMLKCEDRQFGFIRFNLWMIPVVSEFDRAIDEFRSADGMIIDLRGNLGGIGGMVLGVSGHFLDERISLGTLRMRGTELSFFANPRRVNTAGEQVVPYAGPLAILIDGMTLSAAEIFAGGMQAIGRARLFGERSGGQALPAIWSRLPNGDLLYHAFGDFVTANGTRLEVRGVIPDEAVPLAREDLLAGHDAPLMAAMKWIREQRGKQTNPKHSGEN